MKKYTHRIIVHAPLEQVAGFHRDPRALKLLTPPPLLVRFNQIQPLGEGSIADFTLWFGPFPLRWVALHSQVDPLHGFTDTQVYGPFAHWVHSHRFQALDQSTTEIVDQIEAEPGERPLQVLISRLMWLNLPVLFAYRAWATRRAMRKLNHSHPQVVNTLIRID